MDTLTHVHAWTKVALQTTLGPLLSVTMEEAPVSGTSSSDKIVTGVGFVGSVMGVVNFELPGSVAEQITRKLLCLSPEEPADLQVIKDALGEIANMVVGQVKTRLCEAGKNCVLALPTVVPGELRRMPESPLILQDTFGLKMGDSSMRAQILIRVV
ncbi:MAG: chemotaxis protein CheX [Verrucomicrobiales bacterium]|nr:chemotaxis protein CheX [Verrucomicrobiales bacterium]